ncbi:Molybdopterin-guanine dinucleotide biosynthesis protein MobA [Leucobacter sp. 7(1)]|uniref:molybdenum cofactor guanylyltransferase n=1 Tax=Leucobacter sp. 7(1) TaxID=1255613 RepID=UPI00097EB40B|nr:NTP transferase domain-containing protein [Leucobacter sp. 7(1)]SJN10118.1 Molybdopterin-guanine dinucleotide biosynthesis protein MobA [Leucobacter sp. 7(1)]
MIPAPEPIGTGPAGTEPITSVPAAILFAGGRGSRLGGIDKAELRLGGTRLIDRVVAAVRPRGVTHIVVVGPDHAVPSGCIPAREDPPFGGPLAALAAGLDVLHVGPEIVPNDTVFLLSCDLEHPEAVVSALAREPLCAADGTPVDAVILHDPDGRAQWLAGRYRIAPLRAGVAAVGEVANRPLRAACDGLSIRAVPASAALIADIDTPADLARARAANPGKDTP